MHDTFTYSVLQRRRRRRRSAQKSSIQQEIVMYSVCTKSVRFQGYLTKWNEVLACALLLCQCNIQKSCKKLFMYTYQIYILVKPRPLDIMYTHTFNQWKPYFTQEHHHSNPPTHTLFDSLSLFFFNEKEKHSRLK